VNRYSATKTATILPLRLMRSLATLAALGLGLLLCIEDADARLEGAGGFAGGGNASIGFNSVVADASSILPQLLASPTLRPEVAQPTHPGGSLGGLFNRPGLIGGFAAGFLGAGLLGLLFGHGMIGELSGVFPFLGFVFQLTLIVMLGRLIWTWWRADKTTALAELSPRQLADAYGRARHEMPPDIESEASAGGDSAEPLSEAFKRKGRAER